MQLADVVRTLKEQGTAQNRKVYARHGAEEPMFGVSYAVLRPLAKRIGRDQALAEGLWNTGNHDCRALALLVADGATIKKSTLTAWGRTPGVRCLAGELAKVVAPTTWGIELGSKWCAARNDLPRQLGWCVIACLALDETRELEPLLEAALDTIERTIHESPNYTRHAMNHALIAIGGRDVKLKKRALAAARRIGKVQVDHGETGCKTPDAAAYIAKIWARKATRP